MKNLTKINCVKSIFILCLVLVSFMLVINNSMSSNYAFAMVEETEDDADKHLRFLFQMVL